MLPTQEKPYLNSDKKFVWWKFEEIIDIQETFASELNDFTTDGIEVYSERKNRKIKPENAWILPYRKEE